MNQSNEQTVTVPKTADTEVAGGEENSVSLGKFKDVNALLAAYNSLQAEFTKRCQRIKELEARTAVDKDSPTEKSDFKGVAEKSDDTIDCKSENQGSGITEEEKENFIKGYLKEIMGAKSKAIVLDDLGTSVKTPVHKPRTVEEAGRLARELLAK